MTRFRVEPLPPRPSLEYQQKLAKRLLRDCWAGDGDAIGRARAFLPGSPDPDALKLHDAQLVIARGYGFDSWAAMKRKIESLTNSPLEQFDIAVAKAMRNERVNSWRNTLTFGRVSTNRASTSTLRPSIKRKRIWHSSTPCFSTGRISTRVRNGGRVASAFWSGI